ncbi:MAG: hypothetical protein KIS67_26345 [Verrucomicrobiae bacterium]|nr:hypothetical protein [Verrucomicrobiae bacterium]
MRYIINWLLFVSSATPLQEGLPAEAGSRGFSSNAVELNGVIVEIISTNAVGSDSKAPPMKITFTTPAYNKEALRLVLQEANKIAEDLRLPEKLPITQEDIVERFIAPYGITKHRPTIGMIHTKRYGYYVSVGYKMSYVEGTHQDQDCRRWMEQYKWPRSRIDTNAAYQLAAQWLAAAKMDVAALHRDCQIRVEPESYWNAANPKKETTFVPIYDVYWVSEENRRDGQGSTASVKLFAPTKTLISLRVEESKYILRSPLVFTNLDLLLSDSTK